jgi:ABC-type sugar transport system substrate-binding protein
MLELGGPPANTADPSIRIGLDIAVADTQAAGLAVEQDVKGTSYMAAGFDTGGEILRLVKDGVLRLIVGQQPYAQGYIAVTSLALAHRLGLRPVSVDIGATIIQADEIEQMGADVVSPRLPREGVTCVRTCAAPAAHHALFQASRYGSR